MTATADDFRAAAAAAYGALKAAFPDEDPAFWWRQGHAFDTAIDYLATVDGSDAGAFARLAMQEYGDHRPGLWYDDFPWWGLACLRASQRPDLFGHDAAAAFAARAAGSQKALDGNAPYGWACADHERFAEFAPLIEGGVWNHVVDDSCNPSRGDGWHSLCGRQNTVTNALYLVLATRLHLNDPSDASFQEASNREFAFLQEWFSLAGEGCSPDLALLNFYRTGDRTKALVRERVGGFASPHATDAAYDPAWAWAGDQDLLLGALADRMSMVRGFSQQGELRETAKRVVAGTMDYLAGAQGILNPWHPGPAVGGDENDYWTGIAVFMRYLIYAFQHNADLRRDLQAAGAPDFVRANAERVVADPDRPQTQDPVDRVVDRANDPAVLVAAVGMLEPQPRLAEATARRGAAISRAVPTPLPIPAGAAALAVVSPHLHRPPSTRGRLAGTFAIGAADDRRVRGGLGAVPAGRAALVGGRAAPLDACGASFGPAAKPGLWATRSAAVALAPVAARRLTNFANTV